MDSFGFSLTGGGILAPPPLLLTCKGDFITPVWMIPGGDSALEPERTGSSVPEQMTHIFPQIRQNKLKVVLSPVRLIGDGCEDEGTLLLLMVLLRCCCCCCCLALFIQAMAAVGLAETTEVSNS